MKTKRVIQRNLPLCDKYTLIGVSYLSIENGGGCSCDNCGKLITNMATIKSDKGTYTIGLDCLDSILENNNLLDNESYFEYQYSDKPAISKAKSLRAKCIKMAKTDINWRAKFKEFSNGFGFSYETVFNGRFDPRGWDYTFNPKHKELTLNYLKGLSNVILA